MTAYQSYYKQVISFLSNNKFSSLNRRQQSLTTFPVTTKTSISTPTGAHFTGSPMENLFSKSIAHMPLTQLASITLLLTRAKRVHPSSSQDLQWCTINTISLTQLVQLSGTRQRQVETSAQQMGTTTIHKAQQLSTTFSCMASCML